YDGLPLFLVPRRSSPSPPSTLPHSCQHPGLAHRRQSRAGGQGKREKVEGRELGSAGQTRARPAKPECVLPIFVHDPRRRPSPVSTSPPGRVHTRPRDVLEGGGACP